MRILIADDEYSKVEKIANVIKAQFPNAEIQSETTAQGCRKLLRTSAFDLIIIDLLFPAAMGASPSPSGGIELFDLINLDQNISLPHEIIFISGKEDLANDLASEIQKRGCTFLRYSESTTDWEIYLSGKVKFIDKRRSQDVNADILIVTALRTPELEAVLQLPYGWNPVRYKGDPLTYHLGKISRSHGDLKVVAVSPSKKGMPSSAVVAARVTDKFKPKYIIMLGICAGIRGKVNLGDIIIADPTWDWGSGKRGIDEEGSAVFHAAPSQVSLDQAISQLCTEMAHNKSLISEIKDGWKAAAPSTDLGIHVGPMASGASVIADDHSAILIAKQHRELIGIEMEAYAVTAAAELSSEPKPTAIIIKSVCDFADPEKNDNWQHYAAFTSARFADYLLRDPHFESS